VRREATIAAQEQTHAEGLTSKESLVWFGTTKSAQCGGYCAITAAAMLGLMLYPRGEYATKSSGQQPT
jgi:hypothetical protein